MPYSWSNWVFFVLLPSACALVLTIYLWMVARQRHGTVRTTHAAQPIHAVWIVLVTLTLLIGGSYLFSPHLLSNWGFFVLLPAACALVYLGVTAYQRYSTAPTAHSSQLSHGVWIILVTLALLIGGNYAIVRMFSPQPFAFYAAVFSFVTICDGCLAWKCTARVSGNMLRTTVFLILPVLLFGFLFFLGELAHLALFYYKVI